MTSFRSFLRGDVPLVRALLLYGVLGWFLVALIGVSWRASDLHDTVNPLVGAAAAWAIIILR